MFANMFLDLLSRFCQITRVDGTFESINQTKFNYSESYKIKKVGSVWGEVCTGGH